MGLATKNLTTKDTRAGYGRAPCAAAALELAIIRGEGDARGIETKNLTTKDTKDHEGKNPSHGFTRMNTDRNNEMGIATKNLTTKDTRAGYGRAPCAAAA